MEKRFTELEAEEEAGEFTRPPVSGGEGVTLSPEKELVIAQKDIVARPLDEIPRAVCTDLQSSGQTVRVCP